MDPLFNDAQRTVFEHIYSPNVSKVAAAIGNTFETIFNKWNHNITAWETKYVVPRIPDATR